MKDGQEEISDRKEERNDIKKTETPRNEEERGIKRDKIIEKRRKEKKTK